MAGRAGADMAITRAQNIVFLVIGALCLALGSPASAQGRIANARIETRALTGTLERELQTLASRGAAAWIGYRTPMIPGRRHMCCDNFMAAADACCGLCRLESGDAVSMTSGDALDRRSSRIVIEPPSDVVILARVENGAVSRVRTFTPDCDIDGGSMPLVWLENVPAAESVAWLTALVRSTSGSDRERENRVVRPAIGALALIPGQAALATLLSLARDDQRSSIRNQALFWLSQRAGDEAVAAIRGAVENDPEIEVKKRAVFALSRLPKDEGIPLLIQLARTHRNVEVRKQAMFWLGQSHDPRAVSFFEEILKAK